MEPLDSEFVKRCNSRLLPHDRYHTQKSIDAYARSEKPKFTEFETLNHTFNQFQNDENEESKDNAPLVFYSVIYMCVNNRRRRLTGLTLIVKSLEILDGMSIEFEIGSVVVTSIPDLAVNQILHNTLHYDVHSDTFRIRVSDGLCSDTQPLWCSLGFFFHEFRVNVLVNKQFKHLLGTLDVHFADVGESMPYPLPRKEFYVIDQVEPDDVTLQSSTIITKFPLNSRFPTHLFYVYCSNNPTVGTSWTDYIESIELQFYIRETGNVPIEWKSNDMTKLIRYFKETPMTKEFERISKEKDDQNIVEELLQCIPVKDLVTECIMPYQRKDIYEPLRNRPVIIIPIQYQQDVLKPHMEEIFQPGPRLEYVNLHKVTVYVKIQMKKCIGVDCRVYAGSIGNNIIIQTDGMTGLLYSSTRSA